MTIVKRLGRSGLAPPEPPDRREYVAFEPPDFLSESKFKLAYRVSVTCVAALFSLIVAVLVGWASAWELETPWVIALGALVALQVFLAEILRRGAYEGRKRAFSDRQVINALLDRIAETSRQAEGSGHRRSRVPNFSARQHALKRLLDLSLSILALVLFSPLLAFISILVRLNSQGPVFFRQERVGLGGKRFMMLKFRTMRLGVEDEKESLAYPDHTGDPRLFKIPDDPRVTRVGAFLRRWSLDELPQFVNVFRGDMSFVGPRPAFPQDLEQYQEHHLLRLAARPGITGLWQVRGRRDISHFEEVVALDREYIDSWTFWLDLKILAATLPSVFRHGGAY